LSKKLRQPIFCPEQVNIDKIQEDLLDQLSNTWNCDGDHRVDCDERDIVEVAPNKLDQQRAIKLGVKYLHEEVSGNRREQIDSSSLKCLCNGFHT
jgi:hypothetical protein